MGRSINRRFEGYVAGSEESTGSFYLLLDEAMASFENIGVNRLGELLVENGVKNISPKTISAYRLGNSTPTYEKAKILLDTLHYSISEEDLIKSLEKNRQTIGRRKLEEEDYSSPYQQLRISARLNLSKINPDRKAFTSEEVVRYLYDRITTLYGDPRKMGRYLENLIAKDLQQGLLFEEDIKNDED